MSVGNFLFGFEGRINRAKIWLYVLFAIVVYIAFGVILSFALGASLMPL